MNKLLSIEIHNDQLICRMADLSVYAISNKFAYSRPGPVFFKLRNLNFFLKASVNDGALTWPNGVDISPDSMDLVGSKINSPTNV